MKHFMYFLLCSLPFLSLPNVFADEWHIYTSCNDAYALAQDGDHLWWGGRTGIVRYNRIDGTHRLFTLEDYGDGHDFRAAAVAPDGSKWFGQGSNILRFNESGWTHMVLPDGMVISQHSVTQIVFGKDGAAWFSTQSGVARFDGSIWQRFGADEACTDKEIIAAIVDNDGNLWFSESGGGVYRYDGDNWTTYSITLKNMTSRTVNTFASDTNGTLWAGTSDGLAVFDGDVWKEVPPLSETDFRDNVVKAIAADRAGGIWAGTSTGSVFHLRDGEITSYTPENGVLLPVAVLTMLVDDDGVLWVANGQSGTIIEPYGLARFDGQTWSRVNTSDPAGSITTAVAVDEDNVKWFSTGRSSGGNQLVSFDGSSWTEHGVGVNSIAFDTEGRKWFCTIGGVSCFDGESWTNHTSENGLPGTQAYCAAFDSDGIGWFSLDTGLFSFDGISWTPWADSVHQYGDLTGDGSVTIKTITVDKNNVKWFGSAHDGALSYDGDTWRHHAIEDGLPSNSITSMAVDHENVIWAGYMMAGSNVGIAAYDGQSWKNFSGLDLWGNVTGIAVDDKNVKWVVTSVNTHTVYSFDDVVWKSYAPRWDPGLLGGYKCIAIDHEGTKWLGSAGTGIISFRETGGGTVSVVQTGMAHPHALILHGNYPNPFNPSTTIQFSLPQSGRVKLVVYDITGRKVCSLISGMMNAGKHEEMWDGRNDAGQPVASGVYLYRLESGGKATSSRMLLLK